MCLLFPGLWIVGEVLRLFWTKGRWVVGVGGLVFVVADLAYCFVLEVCCAFMGCF